MPALKTHHDLGAFGEPINDLAFAFVTPLGADHGDIAHQPLPPRTAVGALRSSTWLQLRRTASLCQSAVGIRAATVIQPAVRSSAVRAASASNGTSNRRRGGAAGKVERIVSV